MSLDTETRVVRQALRDSASDLRGRLSDQIQALGRDAWLAHIQNTENPHQTTKGQLGLGQVANYPVASYDDAVGGVKSDVYLIAMQLSLVLEEQGKRLVMGVRAPCASESHQSLYGNETSVTLSASPTSHQSDLRSPGVLSRREYRWVEASIDDTPSEQSWSEASDAPTTLDISGLGSGVYLWQCRDVLDDGQVSDWSFPAWVEIHRWSEE